MSVSERIAGLRGWITYLVLIALLLVVTFLVVTAHFPGDTYGDTYIDRVEAAYEVYGETPLSNSSPTSCGIILGPLSSRPLV